MLGSSSLSSTDSGVGVLAECGWNVTERTVKGFYSLQVKISAVYLYLNVCGFVTMKGVDSCMPMLPILVKYVTEVIQWSFQYFGRPLEQHVKFGCGTRDLLEFEFDVSNHQCYYYRSMYTSCMYQWLYDYNTLCMYVSTLIIF